MNTHDSLPVQPNYFPFLSGRFTVSAGLSRLGTEPAFIVDQNLPHYLATKQKLLSADNEKHVRFHDFPADLEAAVTALIHQRAGLDAPQCYAGLATWSNLDAVARQVMEDLVVVRRTPDSDFNSAIHLCFPNGWSPEEKIGKSFFQTHVPVALFEPLNARAGQWVDMMISAVDGLYRFVWGVRFDDFLDHHPASASLPFDPLNPRIVVRVERQVMLGLPEHNAALFVIRTFLYDAFALDASQRSALIAALESMPPEVAAYKGILASRPAIVAALGSP